MINSKIRLAADIPAPAGKKETKMFGLGPWELAIIVFIVLLVFGAGRLPEIGANLGKGIKNFKKAFSEGADPKSSDPQKLNDGKKD